MKTIEEIRAEAALAALRVASLPESKKHAQREYEALRLAAVRAKRRKEKKNGRN